MPVRNGTLDTQNKYNEAKSLIYGFVYLLYIRSIHSFDLAEY